MGGLEAHALQYHESFLYSAGIVTQLGLTAYLFGKGLTDDWCRERIGLDVEKALAFANHLGLGCNYPRIAVLVQLLGNYGQWRKPSVADLPDVSSLRSEEHTSELQSLMRISYAVFCLNKTQNVLKHTLHHKAKLQVHSTK